LSGGGFTFVRGWLYVFSACGTGSEQGKESREVHFLVYRLSNKIDSKTKDSAPARVGRFLSGLAGWLVGDREVYSVEKFFFYAFTFFLNQNR